MALISFNTGAVSLCISAAASIAMPSFTGDVSRQIAKHLS
jgi:hypothetical protein